MKEVEPDESVLSIVSNQRASLIIRHAIERIDEGSEREALDLLNHELEKLEAIQRPELTGDSILLIRSTIDRINGGWTRTRGRKFAQYGVRSYAKMSSHEYWCRRIPSVPPLSNSATTSFEIQPFEKKVP